MKVSSQKFFRTIMVTIVSSVSLVAFAYAQDTTKISHINPGAGILTMINVVTSETGKQLETIQLLQAGMEKTMRHQPGFISANIHRSLNSEHVVVYAQWKDQASVDAASKLIQGGKAPNMSKVFSVAQPAYHPYEVVSIHPASISK